MRPDRGTLRLVVGDQLSDPSRLSSLHDLDPARDVVLMAETMSELTYVRHHKQKIVQTLSAMRRYAQALEVDGVTVRYVRYDDRANTGALPGEIARAVADQPFERVVMTCTGEWRLEQAFDVLEGELSIPFERREDDRYICSRGEFYDWSRDRATLTMEFFYREMRRKTGILMDAGKPAGGRWNFDAENRKRLPASMLAPDRVIIAPDAVALELIEAVERDFPDNFGTTQAFGYATTAEEAERLVAHFLSTVLPTFGDYQDFMRSGDPWLWHARVSAAMNLGLIDPLDLCRRAEAEYRAGRAPLNAVEGFVRQIIGWREFVRGIYWLKGPEYKLINALGADRRLPWFYWSGETDMACVRDVVSVTREHAYAHHIQRLMVTGNLAMLLGVHPDEVNDWYMVVYADAYEWVELPNTHGMATFADGGVMGTKPYAGLGRLHQQDERLLRGLPLRRESAHQRGRLPLQQPLLGLHGAQRAPARRQPPHGDHLRHPAPDGLRRADGHRGPRRRGEGGLRRGLTPARLHLGGRARDRAGAARLKHAGHPAALASLSNLKEP